MSIEYSTTGEIRTEETSASTMAHGLASWNEYEVLEATGDQIRLRFRSADRRSSWTEDVTIRILKDRVYVAFHSGTKFQRQVLIERLTNLLGISGSEVGFEEI